jgi:hypothetical protein
VTRKKDHRNCGAAKKNIFGEEIVMLNQAVLRIDQHAMLAWGFTKSDELELQGGPAHRRCQAGAPTASAAGALERANAQDRVSSPGLNVVPADHLGDAAQKIVAVCGG